jgi:subtilisin family serine protease
MDLFVTGAAGNAGVRLDLAPPESRDGICLVGSTDKNDAIAGYSNYGPRVGKIVMFIPNPYLDSPSPDCY